MTIWKCNTCGNTIPAETPPDLCPSCKQKCEYVDVTCYIPGCGGPESGNVNPQVFKESEDLAKYDRVLTTLPRQELSEPLRASHCIVVFSHSEELDSSPQLQLYDRAVRLLHAEAYRTWRALSGDRDLNPQFFVRQPLRWVWYTLRYKKGHRLFKNCKLPVLPLNEP